MIFEFLDYVQTPIDYMSIPEEELHLFIKMVAFGDTGFAGSKHLAKMISAVAAKELRTTGNDIRDALGRDQPLADHIKTDHIDAYFIEVYSIQCAYSLSMGQPRQHRIDMTLEIVIKGKTFDECLNLFIRRILEEAHAAASSHQILVSHLKATTGQFQEEIDVSKMRERRQQVLGSLKAAVLNEGDIHLDFFIHARKPFYSFLNADARSRGYNAPEKSDGFIHVIRRYKLSFRDEGNNIRCFSRNPLESVALGLFRGLSEADVYVAVYSEHLKRVTFSSALQGQRQGPPSSEFNAPAVKSTLMLNELISTLCGRICSNWERGELVDAGEEMLLFLAIVACRRKGNTHAMQQVKLVTAGRAGHVHAVRDAVEALRASIALLVRDVRASSAVAKELRGASLILVSY